MLTPDEVQRAHERLAAILRAHQLDWIVRRVDDALDEGRQPSSGPVQDLELRRLVLLIEATQRAFATNSVLERALPELLLQETGGRRVHIEPDPEGVADPRLRPPIVIDRDAAREAREDARERTHARLGRLLREALESR